MIYELEKIDAMKWDNAHTINLYIYDIDIWKTAEQKKDHCLYAQKKIEAYVNYILSGGPIEYFSIERKQYNYIIEFVPQQKKYGQYFLNHLATLKSELSQHFGDVITVNLEPLIL